MAHPEYSGEQVIGKLIGLLTSFGKIADWLKMKIFKGQVIEAKRQGRVDAKVEIQNDQLNQLNKGLEARARISDKLRTDPSSLRESDRYEISDGTDAKEGGGLSPSSAPKVEQELAGPSDPSS
jgi:hypothetical protein